MQYASGMMKKIKPFVEIYEYEIAFYALQREIPFQSEECPYMNESIRTDLREFFNKMEKEHPGIKHNAYNSMTKISKILHDAPATAEARKCAVCGRDATGEICSVCKTVRALTSSSSNKQI